METSFVARRVIGNVDLKKVLGNGAYDDFLHTRLQIAMFHFHHASAVSSLMM
jgi:hypothetical protein